MRYLLAGAWQPPAASTFSLPVDSSVPSPKCRWQRQHHYSKQAASAGWLSYSTLALETPQTAAPAPAAAAAAAGRRRHRGVVTSSTRSLTKSPTRGGGLGASSTAASEHKETEVDTVDLVALLDVLGLTERDILPEMSKRSRALLGLGQERGALTVLGSGAENDR